MHDDICVDVSTREDARRERSGDAGIQSVACGEVLPTSQRRRRVKIVLPIHYRLLMMVLLLLLLLLL